MSELGNLSRRERQIMDILYESGGCTVAEVRDRLPDPPVNKAVRRMLHILEEKGYVTRKKLDREFVYRPKAPKKRVGLAALRHVLDTFFEGSVDQAFAAHLGAKDTRMSDEQLKELRDLIDQARRQGR